MRPVVCRRPVRSTAFLLAAAGLAGARRRFRPAADSSAAIAFPTAAPIASAASTNADESPLFRLAMVASLRIATVQPPCRIPGSGPYGWRRIDSFVSDLERYLRCGNEGMSLLDPEPARIMLWRLAAGTHCLLVPDHVGYELRVVAPDGSALDVRHVADLHAATIAADQWRRRFAVPRG